MTNNTASANLSELQRDLTDLYQVATSITVTTDNLLGRLKAVKTQVDALEASAASTPANGAQQALALINAFKAAQGPRLGFATLAPTSTETPRTPAPTLIPDPGLSRSLVSLSGLDLTNQARKLLASGRTYIQTINDLIQLNPGRPREQIRRAVGRANGGAR